MRTTITIEIAEAASKFGLHPEEILLFISDEWVRPHDPTSLMLDEDDLVRIKLISELRLKFGVNDEGIPIILHLIDQLNHLHLELIGDA
jgi:chaperone modulatory protein CbpM